MIKENLTQEPEMRDFPTTEIVAVRAVGPYDKSATEAWNEMYSYATARKLFNEKAIVFGIGHDNPACTAPEKCRYDACVSIDKDVDLTGNVVKKTIEGGKHAVFTYKGPYSDLLDVYAHIFSTWTKDNEDQLAEEPPKEICLNSPDQVAPEELLTEIWFPLK